MQQAFQKKLDVGLTDTRRTLWLLSIDVADRERGLTDS